MSLYRHSFISFTYRLNWKKPAIEWAAEIIRTIGADAVVTIARPDVK
ncbi:hypothetical protein [Mycobacterium interjectum]|nr:hypothetical protein [Mycobacterium interjectum]MCV7090482.1 hypothetical protein [Mycobacterium interjectum]